MLKTRLSAFFSLLIVFVSGAVVGGFAYRLYNPPEQANHSPRPEDIRKHIVSDMRKAINLDDQQVAQLEKIMDEVRSMGDEMRSRMNAEGRRIRDHETQEVKKILRPDQLPLYDKWLAERQAERDRKRRQGGEGPPDRK